MRVITTVVLGPSLLVGISASALLFPRPAGARSLHATSNNRVAATHTRATSAPAALASRSFESLAPASPSKLTAQARTVRQHSARVQLRAQGFAGVSRAAGGGGGTYTATTGHKCPGMSTSTSTTGK